MHPFQRFEKPFTLKMVDHPESSKSRDETELMNKCQRALEDGTVKDPIEKLRLLCFARGATGMVALGRTFRIMDDDDDQALSREEFGKSLHDTGMHSSDAEADELFKRFDTDGNGKINIDEFLIQLRPPMSQSRVKIINQALKKYDETGDGENTIADLRKVYSVLHNPQYTSGELTRDQILNEFLANFENGGLVDGKVTHEELMNYYAEVSASIDKDTYFDLMMRQDYNL